jgi:hypothetical protein
VHTEILQDLLCVREHIHQVRDRRALVTADIGDAGLQQRLGNRQDTLACKRIARAQPEFFDFQPCE